jgi:hypothetical protein
LTTSTVAKGKLPPRSQDESSTSRSLSVCVCKKIYLSQQQAKKHHGYLARLQGAPGHDEKGVARQRDLSAERHKTCHQKGAMTPHNIP